jgi:ketosteroid isomerase-like protein
MPHQNVEIIQQLYAAFFRQDAATILALTAPDIQIEQSSELPWGGSFRGHAGLQEFFTRLRAHLENRALPIERYLDAGNHVVAIGRTQGLVRVNGKTFDVPLVHVWEVREGKAVSFRPFIDHPTMRECLG